MNSGETLWENALMTVQPQLSKVVFQTWLAATKVESFDGKEIIINVPTPMALDHIKKNLSEILDKALTEHANSPVQAVFKLRNAQVNGLPGRTVDESGEGGAPHKNADTFNPRYTFDTFVIGERNKFAHAASVAVAERPAERYNPFFLYGGVGLGKTHLMNAIAQRALRLNPATKVVYVTSEMFVREFIAALQSHTVDDFRNKYRRLDILLIDDIQFISGKESTQEEFFHTFNALYNDHKQIVLTSDRPPHDIPDLEDRLRSRFAGGLLADIQPPEFETRVAIMRKKARGEGIDIPDNAVFLIASRIETNVRELEGALIRVIAFSSMMNLDIDEKLVEQALADLMPPVAQRPITAGDIQKAVSAHFRIKVEDLKARSRKRDIACARQVAMFLTREMTGLSLPKIGEEFGGRDHTTVIHACEKIQQDIVKNHQLARSIVKLRDALNRHSD